MLGFLLTSGISSPWENFIVSLVTCDTFIISDLCLVECGGETKGC